MKRILCIWLPHWPLQRYALAQPELAGRPVLLYEASPQGGLKVVGYAPRLGGRFDRGPLAPGVGSLRRMVRRTQLVLPGMPLAEAIALIGASGAADLQIEVHDPWADQLSLEELAQWCQQFSPTVGIESSDRPDAQPPSALLLDVTGSAHTFGGEAALMSRLETAFAQRGLQIRLALADTIGAAWALAHYHNEPVYLTPRRLLRFKGKLNHGGPINHGGTENTEKKGYDMATHGASRGPVEVEGQSALNLSHSEHSEESPPTKKILHSTQDNDSSGGPDTLSCVRVAQRQEDQNTPSFNTTGQPNLPVPAAPRHASVSGPPNTLPPSSSSPPPSPCPPCLRGSNPLRITRPHRPGQLSDDLVDLSVEALRLPPETLHWLAQLGVQRIGQLAMLPRPALASRFGPRLLERLDQALGTVDEVIVSRRPPQEWTADWLLEYPTDRREAIEIILQRLLARLIAGLENPCRGITQLECRLEAERDTTARFSLRLFQPSTLADHIFDLLVLRLETIRLADPIVSVHLTITETATLGEQQQRLFDASSKRFAPFSKTAHTAAAPPRELAMLVDRLSSRLGRQAVLKGRVLPDAQPEFAGHYQPLQQPAEKQRAPRRAAVSRVRVEKPSKEPASQKPALPWRVGERPLSICSRPMPLEVWTRPDGLPLAFRCDGRQQHVAAVWGPERIETGWWRSRCIRRDYYQVETTTGGRYWLFRQLTTNQWFLHGMFD